MAANIQFENSTGCALKIESVNTYAPNDAEANAEFQDGPCRGVAYVIRKRNETVNIAKWIFAWIVEKNKVYTKILKPDDPVNWKDINDELENNGQNRYTCTAYGFQSVVTIVPTNDFAKISASLSRAPV